MPHSNAILERKLSSQQKGSKGHICLLFSKEYLRIRTLRSSSFTYLVNISERLVRSIQTYWCQTMFTLKKKFPDSLRTRNVLIANSFWCLHTKHESDIKKIPVLSRIRNVMNPEFKLETLYQNTLNPKRLVCVNGLPMNPDILRSPAILLAFIHSSWRLS